MPVDPGILLAFIGAAALISIAPGPDMVFVVASGVRHGARGGLAAALGVSGGMLIHTAAAVIGLSALIQSSTVAFETIRWLGVAYLLWLALGAWREGSGIAAPPGGTPQASLLRVGRQGALTNLMNPKVIVFFLAFLPQFLDHGHGAAAQLLTLGLTFTVVGVLIDGAIGVLAGRLGERISSSAQAAPVIDRLTGIVFVALAVRLVGDR